MPILMSPMILISLWKEFAIVKQHRILNPVEWGFALIDGTMRMVETWKKCTIRCEQELSVPRHTLFHMASFTPISKDLR